MKKIFFAFVSLFLLLFVSCSTAFEQENKYQKLTVINQTNLHIKYSVIKGSTSATTSNDFYAVSHNYLKDRVNTNLKQQLLSPAGTTSGGYQLDRTTFEVDKGTYNCTIFVCKSNNYTSNPDQYINKQSFVFSSDKTITIAANGNIY